MGYAKCVEVENQTGHSIQADVTYNNDVTTSADIAAGAMHVFQQQLINHGSYHSTSPVQSLKVSFDRPHAGRFQLTHQVQVTGIHNCVRRVVKPNLGGATVE